MLRKISRRSFINKSLGAFGGLAFSSFAPGLSKLANARDPHHNNSKIAVVYCSKLDRDTIQKMVHQAFAQFGGINKLIKKDMKVVIKPNIAWNSYPEQAHNTNPYLVETVSSLCKDQGADVMIFDRTCSNARLSYQKSGIADAAKRTGARIEHIDYRKFVKVDVPNGLRQKSLLVYKPLLDSDYVINMPIAKHHGSSNLSISMKNLMGVIGGNRGAYHIGLHQNIVDFTKAIKVDLVICDALRILTKYGPNGGGPEDIKETRTIIMGTNPLTVDAYATTLFGIKPSRIGYISLASKERMGEINKRKMNIIKRSV